METRSVRRDRPAIERFWIAFKLLLSATLLGAPLVLFVMAPAARTDGAAIAITSGMVFLAAIPWINTEQPSRAVGLAGIVLGLGAGFLAWLTASGHTLLPQDCSARRRRSVLWCELENLLHAMGSEYLAALPFALAAGFFLIGSLRLVRRYSHRKRPPWTLPEDY